MDWVILPILLAITAPVVVSALFTLRKIFAVSKQEAKQKNLYPDPETLKKVMVLLGPETRELMLKELEQKVSAELLRQALQAPDETRELMLKYLEKMKPELYKISIEDPSGKKIEVETPPDQARPFLEVLSKNLSDASGRATTS